ncbi:MAG: hypothetical protein JKY48_19005 [Flavobacteriales bacterium]|nr:hypothetical protein [Flavobacteriales bacterium]
MKKLVLSCILTIGFAIYGFATNKVEIQTQTPPKEIKKNSKKETKHYDFSLFKFIKSYSRQAQEKDSTNASENQAPTIKAKNATTYHYERPLDFFKFS